MFILSSQVDRLDQKGQNEESGQRTPKGSCKSYGKNIRSTEVRDGKGKQVGNWLGVHVQSSDAVEESRREGEGVSQKSELQMARKPGQGVLRSQDGDMGTTGQDGIPAFGSSGMVSTSFLPKPEMGLGLS